METIRKRIREILISKGIKYSVRDYYKLAERDPKLSQYVGYGVVYFVNISTDTFNLKLRLLKGSDLILISYEDCGENNYFCVTSKIENFEEKISISMYLIQRHLKSIQDMSLFESDQTPIGLIRDMKLKSLEK